MSAARADAAHCFVCGPANPIGLRRKFRLDGAHCHGEFTALADHVGFDGVTHGGIVFSVLDDAMAHGFFLQGARGYTAKAEIRFRAPMPVGATALITCALVRRKGRLLQLTAVARDHASDPLFAESSASFMREGGGQLLSA